MFIGCDASGVKNATCILMIYMIHIVEVIGLLINDVVEAHVLNT